MTPLSAALARWRNWRLSMRIETLALVASIFFALACNGLFWRSSFAGREFGQLGTWLFAGELFVALVMLHFILLSLMFNRWTAKPLLTLLTVVTAFATYYMSTFTVFLDPSMLRNVLRTDVKEASELFNAGMLPHLVLYAVLPLLFLSRVHLRLDSFRRSTLARLLAIALAIVVGAGALLLGFHELAPLMRNHKEIRYLITPGNYLYSIAKVLGSDASAATRERIRVGLDATKGENWKDRTKPTLFVIVVGETARTANWGLSGYARQTTPELSKLDVINFQQTTSCGTNTEVSVPCLFSVYGRRNYDEDKIRNSESLLNILDRAGMKVIWRDNQSGCKGVCTGVEEHKVGNSKIPDLCDGDRCLDEVLLHGLDGILADTHGNLVLVLHQLGNHGPAYFKRYPPAFRKFEPVCETSDLAKCSREAIVNAYDNALLYTDHMLAQTIAFLKKQEEKFDTGMIYLSDHGESLGENGLYLHGVPYPVAPKVQKEVPMVMWFSPSYAKNFSLDVDCLRAQATRPVTHDHFFHSVLGLLDIRTTVYDRTMDISQTCRPR
ncbi:MAG: phosphoethanolamine--lipid A transferase [Propionivibrio sp.]|jgi:lipid A ethanolaminephosphotransferase|nr:phosphoethanolamine--lipid A transferase [Propionivibrio sp.]